DLLLRRDNPVVALYTLGLLLVQTLLLGLQLLDAELGALVGDAGALDLIGVAALAGCCQVGFGLLQVESRRPLIQRVAAQRPGDILQMLDRVRAGLVQRLLRLQRGLLGRRQRPLRLRRTRSSSRLRRRRSLNRLLQPVLGLSNPGRGLLHPILGIAERVSR